MSNTRCGKKRYDDRETAEIALGHIRRNSTRKKKPKRAYLCHKCGGWHLTSMTQSEIDKLINKCKDSRQKRIRREADYWIDKLGVRD